MFHRHLFASGLAVCLAATIGASPVSASGPRLAYNFSRSPISYDPRPVSLGFTFTVTKPVGVNALGYWDQNGDGFLTPHEVGIFLGDGANGPGPLLAATVLWPGTSGYLASKYWSDMSPSGFRFQSLGRVLDLFPGQSYTIAGVSWDSEDPWIYGGPSETWGFWTWPGVDIGPDAARYTYDTPYLTDPANHYADYQFYAVNFTVVPEPAAWAMMLVGFVGLGAVLRSRRKSAVAPA